jgi:hypothetical protein
MSKIEIGASQNDPSYKVRQEYQQLIKEHNRMVKEHNALVDQFNKLTDDSNALLRFIEDICKGLHIFVTGIAPINNTFENGYIEVSEHTIWDISKQFCADLHNEIYSFIRNIEVGASPKKAYEIWIDKCVDIYNQTKMGGM